VIGPAGSVVEAMALVRRERPDVALLDLTLRDGLAVPVAEMLGRLAVPFAVTTGGARVPHDAPVLRSAPCLAKPYGLGELVRRRLASGRADVSLHAQPPAPRLGRRIGRLADDSKESSATG
jgi:hypothetical protein